MALMLEENLHALKERVFLIDHPRTRIFAITGPDHIRYLHNRLTQDVKGLAVGEGGRSFVLTPNGRIAGQFLMLKQQDGILLVADEIAEDLIAEEIKSAILQFKVADQLELKDLSSDLIHLSLVGDPVHEQAAKLGFAPSGEKLFSHEKRELAGVEVTAIRTETEVTKSFEILATPAAAAILKVAAAVGGIASANPELKEALRIFSAIPAFGVDTSQKTLAPECRVEDYISFSKGCYPGQEVVEMATARGRPNRKFIQVLCAGKVEAPIEVRAGDASIGTLSSAIYLPNADRSVALGFVKSDAPDGFATSSDVACVATTPEEIRAHFI